eukprot:2562169-Pleurochrysis_carterae.AAC.4
MPARARVRARGCPCAEILKCFHKRAYVLARVPGRVRTRMAVLKHAGVRARVRTSECWREVRIEAAARASACGAVCMRL